MYIEVRYIYFTGEKNDNQRTSIHNKDQDSIIDMYYLESRALQIHSKSCTLQCLRDGDEGFHQFRGERECSDISAVTALGGGDL